MWYRQGRAGVMDGSVSPSEDLRLRFTEVPSADPKESPEHSEACFNPSMWEQTGVSEVPPQSPQAYQGTQTPEKQSILKRSEEQSQDVRWLIPSFHTQRQEPM